MLKIFLPFFFCCLISFICSAQSGIYIATGISVDVNNQVDNFYHIPVSVELVGVGGHKKRTEPMLKLNYSIPFSAKRTAYAYTLNSSLPGSIALQEKIHPYIFNIGFVLRIKLTNDIAQNNLYLDLMPIAYSIQKFDVTYPNYDKNNYLILNPDESLNVSGFSIGAGLAYTIPLKKNGLTVGLFIQSPPAASRGDYPLSYSLCTPLQLTFGYNILSRTKRK